MPLLRGSVCIIDSMFNLMNAAKPKRKGDTSEKILVSGIALLKMLKHGKAGIPLEVIGIMLGRKIDEFTVEVFDVFATPQVATGQSVETTDEQFQYNMMKLLEQTGYRDLVSVGWYHSHPGLYCFFSEIDVRTHRLCQLGYGAFTGLVIDPINTTSSGKVNLGSYVTFPENPEIDRPEALEKIPRDVLLKYGTAANKYYELEIKYFATNLDRKVLTDITTRSYGQAIACSPLQLNASYVASRVKEAAERLENDNGTSHHLGEVAKIVSRVNEARRTGIWVERMKRAAFG